jgi:hypothetical protein
VPAHDAGALGAKISAGRDAVPAGSPEPVAHFWDRAFGGAIPKRVLSALCILPSLLTFRRWLNSGWCAAVCNMTANVRFGTPQQGLEWAQHISSSLTEPQNGDDCEKLSVLHFFIPDISNLLWQLLPPLQQE